MKFSKSLLASAALVASVGTSASAQVAGSMGGPLGGFLGLSTGACTFGTPCTLGSIGSIVGGTVYMADQPFADIPAGGIFQGRFLAAGPTPTAPATLTFSTGIRDIGFVWGSPDLYNVLTVNWTNIGGSFSTQFTAVGLGFPVTNGDQSVSTSVRFVANTGSQITSLVFNNSPQVNAFEAANFSTTVPEPSTYVLMAAGLAALGLVSKRRKQA
ncbi:PEP-CTERM sorting domain-containing protein [Gemmatimonas sp.]|uniref:Npun_F0296 family exosortase-dependent surface protein n=1 Tax=Gemmatimonas sp. TaxID=1962908 RepID=UPI00356B4557